MRVKTRLEQGLQLGFVTQLVEYQTFNLRVVGSIPTEPIKETLWQTESIVWKL